MPKAGECDLVEVDGKKYVQATYFTINEYYNLGHVINDPGAFTDAEVKACLQRRSVMDNDRRQLPDQPVC